MEYGHGFGHAEIKGKRWNSKFKGKNKICKIPSGKKAKWRNKDISATAFMLCYMIGGGSKEEAD